MAFPYVDHTWSVGNVLTIARMNNLESQFQSLLDLLTTRGDITYRGAATWERLAKGTEGQYLRQGANDPEWGSPLTVAETEVFNGTSPTAWTDLDLSGTIGANPALVLLKIYPGEIGITCAVRKNGDTDEFYSDSNPAYTCGAALLINKSDLIHEVAIVATNADGIIEWRTGAATAGTTIDIIGYIK